MNRRPFLKALATLALVPFLLRRKDKTTTKPTNQQRLDWEKQRATLYPGFHGRCCCTTEVPRLPIEYYSTKPDSVYYHTAMGRITLVPDADADTHASS